MMDIKQQVLNSNQEHASFPVVLNPKSGSFTKSVTKGNLGLDEAILFMKNAEYDCCIVKTNKGHQVKARKTPTGRRYTTPTSLVGGIADKKHTKSGLKFIDAACFS